MSMFFEGITATIKSEGFSLISGDLRSFFSMIEKILSIPIEAPTHGMEFYENIPTN